MIVFQATPHGMPQVLTSLKGIGVYLDNWAIIELANGPAERRERFVASLKKAGSLLFSFTNGIELGQAEGPSAERIAAFLDSIGAHWIPLEMNPWTVAIREKNGELDPTPCISNAFIKAFVQDRLYELSPEGTRLVDIFAPNFFALSSVMKWSNEKKDENVQGSKEIDEILFSQVKAASERFKADQATLDALFPPVTYSRKTPAMFALLHLLRRLVKASGNQPWKKGDVLKKGDGRDLCHAVLGSAYSTFVALDKYWKNRIEALPSPNELARVYYAPELDQLVSDLEDASDLYVRSLESQQPDSAAPTEPIEPSEPHES